jgi:DNA-binding NtrC family response regulator
MIYAAYFDEDETHCLVLNSVLRASGLNTSVVSKIEEAFDLLLSDSFDIALCHLVGSANRALSFLKSTQEIGLSIPIVFLLDRCSVEQAVLLMQAGAVDLFQKPVEANELVTRLKSVLDRKNIAVRSKKIRRKNSAFCEFISQNPDVQKLLGHIDKVAAVDSSVLITGESGTGKELLARRIHENSPRKQYPFIPINCGAIPSQLLESELFGHEAGAFTGAEVSRIGIFESGSNGTIFLDEIGDMPYTLQVKLLRTLQEGEIKRVGGTRIIKVAPRIVSATNHSPAEAIANGTLRSDLFYRLGVIEFHIPPLRERPEDIPLLAMRYLENFCREFKRPVPTISEEVWSALARHKWPGNARELENVMERVAVLAEELVTPAHLGLPFGLTFSMLDEATISLTEIAQIAARRAEAEVLLQTLKKSNWNKSKTAKALGISYKTLLTKVKEYKLHSI